MTVPGWPSYGSKAGVNPIAGADLGALRSDDVTMIPEYDIDYRCPLYTEIYAALNNPALK